MSVGWFFLLLTLAALMAVLALGGARRDVRRARSVTQYRKCGGCGMPVVRDRGQSDWFEYPAPGLRVLHTPLMCAFTDFASRGELLAALTEDDRAWLRENGWNGR